MKKPKLSEIILICLIVSEYCFPKQTSIERHHFKIRLIVIAYNMYLPQ